MLRLLVGLLDPSPSHQLDIPVLGAPTSSDGTNPQVMWASDDADVGTSEVVRIVLRGFYQVLELLAESCDLSKDVAGAVFGFFVRWHDTWAVLQWVTEQQTKWRLVRVCPSHQQQQQPQQQTNKQTQTSSKVKDNSEGTHGNSNTHRLPPFGNAASNTMPQARMRKK